MPAPKDATAPTMAAPAARREMLGIGLIFLGVVWFYTYIGLPPLYPVRFNAESQDYYNLLVDGFRAGRLGFKIDPPPALVALADPYEPTQRAQAGNVGMHDVTYFKGRYYLYFGVAPALTVFLPFKLLTGLHFPQSLATVLFCAGGYLCSLGLLVGLRRRYFPQTTSGWIWLAAVMLGLGNFCPLMLARNSVWELPIASAYFYSSLGFWLLFVGLTGATRRLPWLVGASAAFGVAVASRPHFVFVGVVLGGLWIGHEIRRWRRREHGPLAIFLRDTAVIMLPFGLIVVGLLLYNYARFENPFEFGQKYQLAGNRQIDSQLVSFRFYPINFYLNFLAPAQLERYFPFFHVVRGYPGLRPTDYGGAEYPFGVLSNLPVSWLAILAPALWTVAFRGHRALGGWLLIFGLTFLALATAVMCFAWSASRYMVDFLPTLLLVALLGLLMASQLGASARVACMLSRIAVFGAVGFTVVFNLLITFRHDKFQAHRPKHFAALADWFNRPALWWETRHPLPYGPVELRVRFPTDKPGKAEPLIVSGVSYLSDYLYVYYYPDLRRVQFGFMHTNYNQVLSQPIPVDYHVPHRIGVSAGSLYPMATHPFFVGRPAAEVKAARGTLRITLDGVPYVVAEQAFFESSPEFLTFGKNDVSDYVGREFTGKTFAVRRQPLASPIAEFSGGSFVRLGLVFPQGASGRREPIVATGLKGKDDLLFVAYEADDRVRLGFHHAGAEPVLSQPLQVKAGDIQLLEVSFGSFYLDPKNARERELTQLLVVRLNGQAIWTEPMTFHAAGGQAPVIGRDLTGDGRYSGNFSGRVVAQQPVQLFPVAVDSPFVLPPYWLETGGQPGYGAMRLHLELPRQAVRQAEPLLVTGATAATADYVSITYPQPGQLSLGYLHAGMGGSQSPRVPVDAERTQLVEIDLPSLYPSEGDDFFATRSLREIAELRKNRVRIKLNGRLMLERPTQAYESTPEQVTVGVDQLEQALGARFSGRIHAIERASTQPPAGLTENSGPLEMNLVFPANPESGVETLLASGDGEVMDALSVVYEGGSQVRFRIKLADGTSMTSAAVPIERAANKLQVNWGGLYPETLRPEIISTGEWRGLQRRLQVSLNGRPVLAGDFGFLQATPQAVRIGQPAGDGAAFTGALKRVRRVP